MPHNKRNILQFVLFIYLILAGCSLQRIEKTETKVHSNSGEVIMTASYYGEKFRGKETASGEIFDPDQLTAAHRSYPFGTRLVVTSVKTKKSVTVRINDRGPFVRGRDLDLSRRAARAIGLTGVAKVRVKKL